MSLIFYDAAGVSGYHPQYITAPRITKFSGSLTAHRLAIVRRARACPRLVLGGNGRAAVVHRVPRFSSNRRSRNDIFRST